VTLAMTESRRAIRVTALIGTLGALLLLPSAVLAQTQPSNAIVTIVDTLIRRPVAAMSATKSPERTTDR